MLNIPKKIGRIARIFNAEPVSPMDMAEKGVQRKKTDKLKKKYLFIKDYFCFNGE